MSRPPSSAAPARLTDAQLLDWLQLIRSENVGPRTFRALINRFGGAAAALDALPALARKAGNRPVRPASRADCEREMEAMRRLGGVFISLADPEYPAALKAIDAPPPLLAVRGRLEFLNRPMVAIVGSRNASANGSVFAERLSREIGQAGYVVASGLARGIDARAHRASLRTGAAAVLAGGLDRVYPPEHASLMEEVVAHGIALSEMALGLEPRGRDFPRRNRIVSGLALATVVVEASRRSGSLITARFALEQGREVFAVPGSPLDPRAEGTNDLLRQGATLCLTAADVVAAVDPLARDGLAPKTLLEDETGQAEPLWDESDLFEDLPAPTASAAFRFDEAPSVVAPVGVCEAPDPGELRHRILNLTGPAPVGIDVLVRVSEGHASDVRGILSELELEGRIERRAGDLVALTASVAASLTRFG